MFPPPTIQPDWILDTDPRLVWEAESFLLLDEDYFTGKMYGLHPNGALRYVEEFLDGSPIFEEQHWDEQGRLSGIKTNIDDVAIERTYWPNGQLSSEEFHGDERLRPHRRWYEDGKLQEERQWFTESWTDGCGRIRFWDRNGIITAETLLLFGYTISKKEWDPQEQRWTEFRIDKFHPEYPELLKRMHSERELVAMMRDSFEFGHLVQI